MQIASNLNKDSKFAQEILLLIDEYKQMNILLKGGKRRQIQLNYSLFNEKIPWSCLIDEL